MKADPIKVELPDVSDLDALDARDLHLEAQRKQDELERFELETAELLVRNCPHPVELVIKAAWLECSGTLLGCQGCGLKESLEPGQTGTLPFPGRDHYWTADEFDRAMCELRELEPHERDLMSPDRQQPLFDDHDGRGYN